MRLVLRNKETRESLAEITIDPDDAPFMTFGELRAAIRGLPEMAGYRERLFTHWYALPKGLRYPIPIPCDSEGLVTETMLIAEMGLAGEDFGGDVLLEFAPSKLHMGGIGGHHHADPNASAFGEERDSLDIAVAVEERVEKRLAGLLKILAAQQSQQLKLQQHLSALTAEFTSQQQLSAKDEVIETTKREKHLLQASLKEKQETLIALKKENEEKSRAIKKENEDKLNALKKENEERNKAIKKENEEKLNALKKELETTKKNALASSKKEKDEHDKQLKEMQDKLNKVALCAAVKKDARADIIEVISSSDAFTIKKAMGGNVASFSWDITKKSSADHGCTSFYFQNLVLRQGVDKCLIVMSASQLLHIYFGFCPKEEDIRFKKPDSYLGSCKESIFYNFYMWKIESGTREISSFEKEADRLKAQDLQFALLLDLSGTNGTFRVYLSPKKSPFAFIRFRNPSQVVIPQKDYVPCGNIWCPDYSLSIHGVYLNDAIPQPYLA